ncbi:uncharacterized protein LOC135487693 [Lineus longissimus]|uniref:uncharacterized protein LOC135487693 n=1 Tax=Lineus longissimus TaxID=88925 RepID=UPI00315CAD3C
MPSYKLHYFNARGFAEISRLLFAAAGVEYEDIRYDGETWREAKKKMPYGVVPVLEVDGEMIGQSFAIAKYLARTFGFNGSNSMEEAKIDEMIEHTRDMMKDFIGVHFEKDEDKKKELLKEMQDIKIPKHLGNFEKVLCKNKGGDGFCVGDKLSIADIQLFHVLGWVSEQEKVLATFPKCLAFFGRIKEIPRIKEWLEKRPVTTNYALPAWYCPRHLLFYGASLRTRACCHTCGDRPDILSLQNRYRPRPGNISRFFNMPSYKLHYFNARGFAEISRLIFAAAGVEYEDIRYDRETTWPAAKAQMPHGTVPVLEIDGVKLTQSFAIAKYLATIYGFNGSNPMETARIDEACEHTRDLMKDFIVVHQEKDDVRKAELEKNFQEVKLPVHMEKLEKELTKNNNGKGFFVGDKLSLADLAVMQILSWMPEAVASYPNLKALLERVENFPGIKEWVAKRPKTAM